MGYVQCGHDYDGYREGMGEVGAPNSVIFAVWWNWGQRVAVGRSAALLSSKEVVVFVLKFVGKFQSREYHGKAENSRIVDARAGSFSDSLYRERNWVRHTHRLTGTQTV